jgi:hypothetical protein
MTERLPVDHTIPPTWDQHRSREFLRIVDQRKRANAHHGNTPEWPTIALANVLDQHSAPDHVLADRTPVTDPTHWVVGQEFAGTDTYDNLKGKRWFCFSHDVAGYWMYATDGSGHWTNVSEMAINRSFWQIHRDPDGRLSCSWFRGKVPPYTNQEFTRHKDVTITP